MWSTVKEFALSKESEAREKFKLGNDAKGWQFNYAKKDIIASGPKKNNINNILYRPFDNRFTYLTKKSSGFMSRPCIKVMAHFISDNNVGLCVTRHMRSGQTWQHCFVSSNVAASGMISNRTGESGSLLPLYLNTKTLNLSPEIQQILTQTYKQPIESLARPFFNYIYTIFHAPSFRTRYAEFLKQDFPRVQITPDKKLFFQLAKLGQELTDLHLLKGTELKEGKTQFKDEGLLKNAPKIVSKVTYDSKSQKVFINENHYFSSIDEETFQFQIGGYQVLHKWLKDRKGRELTSEDISHYIKVVESLKRTQKLMLKIDDVILKAGGWPLVREELKKAA